MPHYSSRELPDLLLISGAIIDRRRWTLPPQRRKLCGIQT
jgi:hypothetical protein